MHLEDQIRATPAPTSIVRILVAITVAIALSMIFAPAVPAATYRQSCPEAAALPDAVNVDRAAAVTCVLNVARRQHGLPRLRRSGQLDQAADRHARSILTEGVFDHVNPGGPTLLERVQATGYLQHVSRYRVAENLGWGTDGLATPLAMLRAWMASPGHRHNVLDPRLRAVGVAAAAGAPQDPSAVTHAVTYVTDFGRRSRARR